MTLYKQLVAGMVAVLILLMIFVFLIELNTTRNSLEQQQRSEVSNTINTVGLALAPYLEQQDTVATESVINALFDGSTYSVVRLVFLDSNEEISRTYPIKPNQVPEWFTRLNLFEPIHDKRIVTSGWLQLAEVEIISHPGEAYTQLWNAFVRLGIAFAIITLLSLAAVAFIVRHALKPLKTIVDKMEQIARNHFSEPLPLPNTKDLIHVVEGINSMSKKVEKYFKSQAKEAQQLREQAYIDPVSQLGNRAYFMSQLNSWIAESGVGGAAILHAQFIADLYEEKGYADGDNMVKEIATHLKTVVNSPNATLARISADEFACIIPHLDREEIRTMAQEIIDSIDDLDPDPTGIATEKMALGVIHNEKNTTSTEVLSLLDNAVADCKSNPETTYGFISSESDRVALGKQQWKSLVEEAIFSGWVKFRFQAARDINGITFHKEAFSAIEKDGVRYTANQYLFALEQLNASHLFDKYVLNEITTKLESGEITDTIAINIAQNSIEQPSFIRWVSKLLERHRSICHKLHFELPENCFINSPHHTALFCDIVRSAGSDFGVDNYGRNFKSLNYINEFRPKYVKLDYLLTHHLDDEKQKFTLTSLSRTAHNLGLTTIASRVETQSQLDSLSKHFIDVFQGFIVDK